MGDEESTEREQAPGQDSASDRREDMRVAFAGGAVAALVGFGGMAFAGQAGSAEALRLLEALIPTVRFAASGYIAAGATILALMLTLLTFSISNELEFRPTHYRRIRDIALLTTAAIVASVMILMFLSLPLDETDQVDRGWYIWAYYGFLIAGAATGGAFISLILMLYYAVRGLIGIGHADEVSDLIVNRPDDG